MSANHRLEAVADRLELAELLHRYAWAIDSGDFGLLAQVFTEDAEADFSSVGEYIEGAATTRGRDAIIAWLRAALEPFPEVLHFMSNQLAEVEGDRARTLTYMHVLHMPMGGIYHGEAVRTRDGWRLRRLRLEERSFEAAAERLRGHMQAVAVTGRAG
jgi:hypothetical protein